MNETIETNKYLNTKNNPYRKNVYSDYVFCFLKNFDISSAIWVLYMVYRGLPLWQIGIVEGIFHIASFIFEVPSGAIADLFGRKRTIIAGRLFSILSAIINLFANNIVLFSISFIISALSYNLNSGSEEALVYDSLKKNNAENDYIKVNSKLNMIIEVSQGLGTIIGGILAEHSYISCYLAVIFISAISLIPAFLFTEPSISNKIHTSSDNKKTIINENVTLSEINYMGKFVQSIKNSLLFTHFKNSYYILKDNKKILKILIYFPIVETFNTVVFFYGQQYFNLLGFNKIQISLIMLFSGLLSCLGAYSSEKAISIFKNNAKYASSILMALSIVLLGIKNIIISVIFFGIMNFANSLLYPIQSVSLNELIPSNQRATIISISSMIFSLSMIVFFPLCGFMADMINLNTTFMILGIIQFMLIILLAKKIK